MPFNFSYFPSNCTEDPDFRQKLELGFVAMYHVVLPCCIGFGLLANLITFVAFIKQKEPYFYQIALAGNQLMETIFAIFYDLSMVMYGYMGYGPREGPAVDWFRSNYFLMFYRAHLRGYLPGICTTTSVLLIISIAADRVFALSFPARYRTKNHKLHKAVALGSCIFIGFSISFYMSFIETVVVDKVQGQSTMYLTVGSDEFINHAPFMDVLSQVRNASAILAFIFLGLFNGLLIRAFRKYINNASKVLTDDESRHARKRQERVLVRFSVCISIIFVVKYVPFFTMASIFWVANPSMCFVETMSPASESLLCLDCIDFYIVFVFNKQLRQAIYDLLPFLQRAVDKITNSSNVKPISVQNGQP